jgi:hypothetical protein
MRQGKAILMATLGSRLYGCPLSKSDRNFVKVCSPSKADLDSGDTELVLVKDNGLADRKKETTVIYSPKSFIERCVAGQAGPLELAFLPKDCLQWEDSSGMMMTEWIRAKCVTQRIIENYNAIITANIAVLQNAFDAKLCCDSIRLCLQATSLGLTYVRAMCPIPTQVQSDTLWRIRRGRIVPFEALAILTSAQMTLNALDISHLPMGIPSGEVDDIIARVHQDCLSKG